MSTGLRTKLSFWYFDSSSVSQFNDGSIYNSHREKHAAAGFLLLWRTNVYVWFYWYYVNLFSRASHLMMDGTFSPSPHRSQDTVHSLFDSGWHMPLVYGLLPGKSQVLDTDFLNEMYSFAVLCDFRHLYLESVRGFFGGFTNTPFIQSLWCFPLFRYGVPPPVKVGCWGVPHGGGFPGGLAPCNRSAVQHVRERRAARTNPRET